MDDLKRQIESLLFLTEKNIPVETISEFFNISEKRSLWYIKRIKIRKRLYWSKFAS